MESLLQLNREIERMVTHDVTLAKIDIALVLLERLGEKLRLYQSAYSQKPRFVEPIDRDSIPLVSAKY